MEVRDLACKMTDMDSSTHRPRRPVVEVVDEEMARVLTEKSGAERLAIAAGMFQAAQRMIRSQLMANHPEWDRERLQAEVARRLSSATG